MEAPSAADGSPARVGGAEDGRPPVEEPIEAAAPPHGRVEPGCGRGGRGRDAAAAIWARRALAWCVIAIWRARCCVPAWTE